MRIASRRRQGNGQTGGRQDAPAIGRPAILALLAVAALLAAPADTAGQSQTPRPLRELPPATWRHELAWTLSSDDVLFGRLATVALLHDGVLAAADLQLGQVLLIAPDGSLQRVLAVGGEGPGRVGRLAGLCDQPPDGLLLVQAWPGRVEAVRRDGTPVRSLVAGGRSARSHVCSLLSLAAGAGGLVGVQVDVQARDDRRSHNVFRLCRFDRDLVADREVLRREVVTEDRMGLVDETAMDFPVHAWAALDARRVVLAPARALYRLEVHGLDGGGPRAVFARDLAPLPRPQVEMDRLRSEFHLEVDGRRRPIEFVFFETAQTIQEIVALDPDRLLVTTAYLHHDLPPGATARLDLVDLDTASVREILLAVPVRPERDRLVVLPNGDLVVLVGGGATFTAAGPQEHEEPTVPAIAYWRHREVRP